MFSSECNLPLQTGIFLHGIDPDLYSSECNLPLQTGIFLHGIDPALYSSECNLLLQTGNFLYGIDPELLLTVNQIQAHQGLKRMLILIVQHKTVANFYGKPPFQKIFWILLLFKTLECQLRF